MRKSLMEIFVIVFLAITGNIVVWYSRYYMPHVAVDGFSGSILGDPIILQDHEKRYWAIFNTGESLEPFHLRGKLATLVLPFDSVSKVGMNFVSRVFCRSFPFNSLPPVCYHYITHNKKNYNIKKIFFGKYSAETLNSPLFSSEYENQISNLNSQINLRNDIIEGRNDILVEMKKFAEEMSGSQKKWYEIFKRPPSKGEEEQ